MKIVFFGTDDFAQVHLQALIDANHRIVGCVTPPDRAKGRGWKVQFSPVKDCARQHGLTLCQPPVLQENSFIEELKTMCADLFIVIAYGKMIPKTILEIPPQGVLNVHNSLLPKYRGAAPIHWAIINGEKETGISIIEVNDVLDGGDILAQKRIEILDQDTSITLREKMKQKGPKILLETIDAIQQEKSQKEVQDPSQVTLAPKLTKELGHIQWDKQAFEIHNLVRGLLPWPSAYTYYKERLLKILRTDVVGSDACGSPGEVIEMTKEGFVVATGKGNVLVKEVHLESSKAMKAQSFIAGHALEKGFRF